MSVTTLPAIKLPAGNGARLDHCSVQNLALPTAKELAEIQAKLVKARREEVKDLPPEQIVPPTDSIVLTLRNGNVIKAEYFGKGSPTKDDLIRGLEEALEITRNQT